jgi:hypothetical protein
MRTMGMLVMAGALAAAGAAQAAGIGVRAGTTGIGADVAWDLAPTLSARLGYSALKWNQDVDTSSGIEYDGKLKLSNVNTFVDFHPLGPVFRLTGGFIFHDNKYDVRAARFGGTLSGTVEAGRSAAPYLGIGWGTVSGTGIGFYADIGVMFMGSPKATLRAVCSPSAACTALQNEAVAEQRRLEDELKDFKHYPVLNLGLTVGF